MAGQVQSDLVKVENAQAKCTRDVLGAMEALGSALDNLERLMEQGTVIVLS
jgi:hypothetical protein